MNATRYEDFLNEPLQDGELRKEYETLEEEFTLANKIIALRTGLNLTPPSYGFFRKRIRSRRFSFGSCRSTAAAPSRLFQRGAGR